jgi:hypothetical protein
MNPALVAALIAELKRTQPLGAMHGRRAAAILPAFLASDAFRDALAASVLRVCNENDWGIYDTGSGGASWVDRRQFASAVLAALTSVPE